MFRFFKQINFSFFKLKWKIIFFSLAFILISFLSIKPKNLEKENSYQFYSTEKFLLKEYSSDKEDYAEKLNLEETPEIFQSIILAAEDKRFFYHFGFDPIAMARAIFQNIRNRKIISGASTITQQLVRIIYKSELPKNILLKKIFEILYSIKFEIYYSKKEILEAYLNQISIRHNYSGISSASKYLFHRTQNFLTREEMISIAILIRQNQPNQEEFDIRFKNLWNKVFESDKINFELISKIKKQIFYSKKNYSRTEHLSSRHFTDWLQKFPKIKSGKIYTNISANQNESIHHILNQELKTIEKHHAENGAVVILKLPNIQNNFQLELASMVGSKNFNESEIGQVNGTLRIRQAGSTLKPFLYGLAFDKKILKPNSIIEDKELKLINDKNEIFIPRNNDLDFWGNITVSESLSNSRNIPAIKTYQLLGGEEFLKLLLELDLDHLDKSAEYYGPSLSLGTGGASLLQLTRAYSMLATKGKLLQLNIGKDGDGKEINLGEEKKIFSEETTYYLKSILSDNELRKRAYGKKNFFNFPFPGVAVKTGTSKDFKDAWAIGFTNEYVIGVWVGNFHGDPMQKISGGYGAGKIFHQIIRLLHKNSAKDFEYPPNFLKRKYCKLTGLIAKQNCPEYLELINTSAKSDLICNGIHSQIEPITQDKIILSPANFESFIIDSSIPLHKQSIPILIQKIDSDKKDFYFYSIDNKPKIEINSDIKENLIPVRGIHKIFIYKNNEIIEEVEFSVE